MTKDEFLALDVASIPTPQWLAICRAVPRAWIMESLVMSAERILASAESRGETENAKIIRLSLAKVRRWLREDG